MTVLLFNNYHNHPSKILQFGLKNSKPPAGIQSSKYFTTDEVLQGWNEFNPFEHYGHSLNQVFSLVLISLRTVFEFEKQKLHPNSFFTLFTVFSRTFAG